jgi:NADH-quinone oxidoreductase subunit M
MLVGLPLVGGVAAVVVGRDSTRRAVAIGLVTSVIVLAISIIVMSAVLRTASSNSDTGAIGAGLVFAPEWMSVRLPSLGEPAIHWRLQLGVDGAAALLVFMTAIVTTSVLVVSIRQIRERLGTYVGLLLMTEACVMGVFVAMDLLTFAVCFEAVLLPLVFLIGQWGDRESAPRAARVFLVFTLAGSIPMLAGLVGLMFLRAAPGEPPTIGLAQLSERAAIQAVSDPSAPVAGADSDASVGQASATPAIARGATWERIIFALLVLGMGIKMAVVPLHGWLPVTYDAAHPTTTAFLAAVVLKLGAFGMLRIAVPLMPGPVAEFGLVLGALGAVAIVYGALAALGQRDVRRLLAYSSLSHVGFISVGLFALNTEGLAGGTLQMLNHGLVIAAMFLLLAMLEARHGRIVLGQTDLGWAGQSPRLAALLVFFCLASAGLPGLNNFVGEVLAIGGMLRVSPAVAVLAALGIVLGAWYSLRLAQRLMFGTPAEPSPSADRDASKSESLANGSLRRDVQFGELAAIVPLAVLCVAIGLRPQVPLDLIGAERVAVPFEARQEPGINVARGQSGDDLPMRGARQALARGD